MKKRLTRITKAIVDTTVGAAKTAGKWLAPIMGKAGEVADKAIISPANVLKDKAGEVASVIFVAPAAAIAQKANEFTEPQVTAAAKFAYDYFYLLDSDRDDFVGLADLARLSTSWMGLPQQAVIAVLIFAIKRVGTYTKTDKYASWGISRESLKAYLESKNKFVETGKSESAESTTAADKPAESDKPESGPLATGATTTDHGARDESEADEPATSTGANNKSRADDPESDKAKLDKHAG